MFKNLVGFLSFLFLSLFYTITAFGQQNFFNVPSSEITEKGKVFFQQQVNFTSQAPVFNTTLDLGLGKNWEFGINFINVSLDHSGHFIRSTDNNPCYPYLTVNASRKFQLNKVVGLTLGGQLGQSQTSIKNWGFYTYQNLSFLMKKIEAKWVIGCYQTSNNYYGFSNQYYQLGSDAPQKFGLQFGFEKALKKDKLFFQIDGMYGNPNVNQIVPGFAYFLSKNWVLSAGVPIKIGYSTINPGFIGELTFVP